MGQKGRAILSAIAIVAIVGASFAWESLNYVLSLSLQGPHHRRYRLWLSLPPTATRLSSRLWSIVYRRGGANDKNSDNSPSDDSPVGSPTGVGDAGERSTVSVLGHAIVIDRGV